MQAPQEPIDTLIAKHATARHLADNESLTIFRLADGEGGWCEVPGAQWDVVARE